MPYLLYVSSIYRNNENLEAKIGQLKDEADQQWLARKELFRKLEEAEANQTVNEAIDYYKGIA